MKYLAAILILSACTPADITTAPQTPPVTTPQDPKTSVNQISFSLSSTQVLNGNCTSVYFDAVESKFEPTEQSNVWTIAGIAVDTNQTHVDLAAKHTCITPGTSISGCLGYLNLQKSIDVTWVASQPVQVSVTQLVVTSPLASFEANLSSQEFKCVFEYLKDSN